MQPAWTSPVCLGPREPPSVLPKWAEGLGRSNCGHPLGSIPCHSLLHCQAALFEHLPPS